MMDEIMVPIDPACIPEGYQAQRFGYGEAGEMEVEYDDNGIKHRSIRTFDSRIPRLIIRKKYDPGIPIAEMMDVDAIKFVLSEIERLTTENRRLQGEVALLSGIVRDLENFDD